MNLYEINADYEKVINDCRVYAEEHDGEISPELTVKLEHYEMERTKKIENVMLYHKNENAKYESIQKEIDSLARRAKAHENNAVWAKTYLAGIVKSGEEMEFAKGRISWRGSSFVEIVDPSKVPDNYMRIIPETKEPDKIAIKEQLKQGKAVEGTALVETQHIQIK